MLEIRFKYIGINFLSGLFKGWYFMYKAFFLVNVHVRYMSSSVRLSVVCLSYVVCNVRAPYSGDWNFRQCFYAIWYLGHLWSFDNNFTEIVPGELLRRGVKPKRQGSDTRARTQKNPPGFFWVNPL